MKNTKILFLVAVAALVWNLLGLMAFWMQVTMSPEAMAALPVDQQQLYAEQPSWVVFVFGAAVISGVLGAIALLFRKAWAFILFAISLADVVLQQVYMFFMSRTFEVMGSQAMVMPLMVLAIAVFLCWYSYATVYSKSRLVAA